MPIHGLEPRVRFRLSGREGVGTLLTRVRTRIRVQHAGGVAWIEARDVISIDPAPAADAVPCIAVSNHNQKE